MTLNIISLILILNIVLTIYICLKISSEVDIIKTMINNLYDAITKEHNNMSGKLEEKMEEVKKEILPLM